MDYFGNLFAGLAGDEYTPDQLRAMREVEAKAGIRFVSGSVRDIAQEQAQRHLRAEMPLTPSEAYAQPLPPQEAGTIDIDYEDVT